MCVVTLNLSAIDIRGLEGRGLVSTRTDIDAAEVLWPLELGTEDYGRS